MNNHILNDILNESKSFPLRGNKKGALAVGIIGGAGYTAGELIRILLNHPQAELTFVQSSSNGGNLLSDVHTDLLGDTEIKFVAEADFSLIDVAFFCMDMGNRKNIFKKILFRKM